MRSGSGRQRAASVRRTGDRGRWWIVPGSIAVALLLTVIPYPEWMRFAVPHWVTLVLFYWSIALPERVGVGSGWITGLILDLLQHTLFGMNAVSKAFVTMVGGVGHRRLRMYHVWQQCIVILLIATVEIAFVSWVFHLTNRVEIRLIYWQAALTTALVWPVVYALLRFLRQRSGITPAR